MQRIRRRFEVYYPMPEGPPGKRHNVKIDLTPEAKSRRPGAIVRAQGLSAAGRPELIQHSQNTQRAQKHHVGQNAANLHRYPVSPK